MVGEDDAGRQIVALLEALGAEIKKSWEEYVDQVGEETANSTSYFNDALNELLADGEKMF